MTVFDDIFNILLPNDPTHALFEFAHRIKRQHFLSLAVALCTMSTYAHVGQAGIGGINQVQVSNYSPIPKNTVIAQPQMLLLISDKHLNRPAFEITDDHRRGRQFEIVGHQCPIVALAFAACKDNVDLAKSLHKAFAHRNAIESRTAKPLDALPAAAVTQHIAAVIAQTSADAADGEVAIGLCNADIMPFTFFAGFDDTGAQIERIEQDRHVERVRNGRRHDRFGGQFGEFAKWQTQFTRVLSFDVEPGAPWYGDASIIETGLENHVAFGVCSARVQMDGSDRIHDFGIFERLCLVDDQEQPSVFLRAEPAEQIQGDLLYDQGFIPGGPPKKFAVIGPVGGVSEGPGQAIDRGAMADSKGHDQRPEVFPRLFGEVAFEGFEKTVQFFGNFADCNHTVSPTIIVCGYKCYRLKRPFLFGVNSYHDSDNRSV